jgi:anti-sigma B factor antagonist
VALEYVVNVSETRSGPVELVKVAGEVDLANAEELRAAIETPDLSTRLGIVLDLRLVPFMDSSGLGTLLMAAQGIGSRLVLIIEPGSPVANLFELSRVENMVRIAATEEQALALLDGAGPGS